MDDVSNRRRSRDAERHGEPLDLIVLSHLRWGFVYQRPQHLLARFARDRHVLFFEEPVFGADTPRVEMEAAAPNVTSVVPQLPPDLDASRCEWEQARLLDLVLDAYDLDRFVLWYYTPMAVGWTRHLRPVATVYDCMDELSAFAGSPTELLDREGELLDSADLVFTGGRSLYEAKRHRHPHVHEFPSGVDAAHFGRARASGIEPADQASVPHPRIGFFGVIDERLDVALLDAVAAERPDLHLVMIGPVVKIDASALPRRPNIHYLGAKPYEALPDYIRGWDVAMLPFAKNEATRFISPTKTPEYLAAGRPVVSTSVRDVVTPYGDRGLVRIADEPDRFVTAIDEALTPDGARLPLEEVDRFLASMSWDRTFAEMRDLVDRAARARLSPSPPASGGDVVTLPSVGVRERVVSEGRRFRPDRGRRTFDWLVVGAGFAGAVLAERLASQEDARVLVVERRPHIAGNAHDRYDDDGILVHTYGPHIFHTNARHVFDHLSAFTEWRPYEHRVLASVDGQLVPIPINLDTINQLYGLRLSSMELQRFFDEVREPVEHPRTSEDVVVGAVGRELYEKFFRNYTRKQWGMDPSELDASVTARVPIRTSRDDRYFTDTYQAMPRHGYTRMFERMLDHPNIKLMLNTDVRDVLGSIPFRQMIYTGPVDEYFRERFGRLPYRSLDFAFETRNEATAQPAAVINHPNEHAFTRVTEFKYLTGQTHHKTTLVYEYPREDGDPYYPVPTPANAERYKRYKAIADAESDVHFVGRLATYKYYNMDQVVAQALAVFERITGRPGASRREAKHGGGLTPVSTAGAVGRDRMHARSDP